MILLPGAPAYFLRRETAGRSVYCCGKNSTEADFVGAKIVGEGELMRDDRAAGQHRNRPGDVKSGGLHPNIVSGSGSLSQDGLRPPLWSLCCDLCWTQPFLVSFWRKAKSVISINKINGFDTACDTWSYPLI